MTYAEYLKAQGATEEDLKALDHPIARRAWEASEAAREAAKAESEGLRKWYNDEAVPAYKSMEQKMIEARAEAARNAALVQAASDQGLIDIATKAGIKKEDIVPPNGPVDTSKFITVDSFNDRLKPLFEGAGESLASLQDMVIEHSQLFPTQRLNVTELRREAVAQHKNVVQLWREKYNVEARRAEVDKAAKDAYDAKLRAEGAEAARAEFASRYGNPDARPLVPSSHPLAARAATGREKQPWELDSGTLERDRVKRATETLIKTQSQQVRN